MAGGLGVLTASPEAPVVTQTAMSADLLQTLQVLTDLVVQDVGHHLVSLAILHVPLSVKEPVWNFVLARILKENHI